MIKRSAVRRRTVSDGAPGDERPGITRLEPRRSAPDNRFDGGAPQHATIAESTRASRQNRGHENEATFPAKEISNPRGEGVREQQACVHARREFGGNWRGLTEQRDALSV